MSPRMRGAHHRPAGWPGWSFRPPLRSDVGPLLMMWGRCGPGARLGRFHSPITAFPPSYLGVLVEDPEASLIAVDPRGSVVALASLFRQGRSEIGELGVLVEDACQRRGIGRVLVARLISGAPRRGINVLTASILAENAGVAGLLRKVPGDFSVTVDGPVMQVRVELAGSCAVSPMLGSRVDH
jgi:GNAT superfamily N-acetyltransferase